MPFFKKTQFFEDYKDFMSDMIAQRFAKRANDTTGEEGHVWYLSHHKVYHPNKPGKLRVVLTAQVSTRAYVSMIAYCQDPTLVILYRGFYFVSSVGPLPSKVTFAVCSIWLGSLSSI